MTQYLLSVHSVEGEVRDPMTEEEMQQSYAQVCSLEEEPAPTTVVRVDRGRSPFPPRICSWSMIERSSRHSEEQGSGPQAWCVCGEKVTIAGAREVTLPNGRPGWEGRCPECGAPLFAIRRKPAGG